MGKKKADAFVVIKVEDGCVVDVQSDADLRVVLVDHDTQGSDSSLIQEVDGEAAEVRELFVEPLTLDPSALLGN